MELIPRRWIKRPPTFRMITISGRFSSDMTKFNGRIHESACQNIVLTKVARDVRTGVRTIQNELHKQNGIRKGGGRRISAKKSRRLVVDGRVVQSALAKLGFDPGPIDGKPGRKTRNAIRRFQRKAGLRVTGKLTGRDYVVLMNLVRKASGGSRPATVAAARTVPRRGRYASFWMHNRSVVGLKASGARREFYYARPRPGIAKACARAGDAVFRGRKDGDSYSGIAYQFSCRCGKATYRVSGRVENEGKRVVMRGRTPLRGNRCRTRGYKNDVLVFDLIEPGPDRREQSVAAANTNSDTSRRSEPAPFQRKQANAPSETKTARLRRAISPKQMRGKPREVKLMTDSGYFRVKLGDRLGCGKRVELFLKARHVPSFANGQGELESHRENILAYVKRVCPAAQVVELASDESYNPAYKGVLSSDNNWQFKHIKTPLSDALADLDKASAKFEHMDVLDAVLKKHAPRFGGPGKPDALALQKAINERKARLVSDHLPVYRTDLAAAPATFETYKKLTAKPHPTLVVVEKHAPQHLNAYKVVTEERATELRTTLSAQVVEDFKKHKVEWRSAAATVKLARNYLAKMDASFVDANDLVRGKMKEAEAAVKAAIPNYAAATVEYGEDWEAYKRLGRDEASFFDQFQTISAFGKLIPIATKRRKEVLASLQQQSIAEIGSFGSGLNDLERLLDLGENRAKRFVAAGRKKFAEELQVRVAGRVTELVNVSFGDFAKGLAAMPMAQASVDELHSIRSEYKELAGSVPAFSRYYEAASTRLSEVERDLCKKINKRSGISGSLAKRPMIVKGAASTLGDYSCQAGKAGNPIIRISASPTSPSIDLEHKVPDSGLVSMHLGPSIDVEHNKALVALAVTEEGSGKRDLTSEEWNEYSAVLMRPRPTGRPDRTGLTECDHLAAHPEDPKKKGPGVADEKVEIERAIDACIAAVEYDADDPRRKFQLGRVLYLAGADKQSRAYLDAASAQGYAAADVLIGDSYLVDEKAAKQALPYYRLALARGYSGVKDRIEMLEMPAIIDFEKDLLVKGTVALVCPIIATSYDQHGNPTGSIENEWKLVLNLDAKTVKVDYDNMVRFDNELLLSPSKEYKLGRTVFGWTFPAQTLAPNLESSGGDISIKWKSLAISHAQRIVLGKLFNIDIVGRLEVEGQCMQDFDYRPRESVQEQ